VLQWPHLEAIDFLLGDKCVLISMLASGISQRDLMLCLGRFRPLWNGGNFDVSYFFPGEIKLFPAMKFIHSKEVLIR
jgi:hypothetical protein